VALQHFSTFCHTWIFLFPLQLLPETFLILRTDRDLINNVYQSSYKVPVIIVRL
jgi:hypothetical protein